MTSRFDQHRQRYLDWLSEAALPLFAGPGKDPAGGFYEALNLDGSPILNAPKRLRVQARQAYSFARAEQLGLMTGGRDASDHAWRLMIDHGRAAEHGDKAADGAGFIHRFDEGRGVLDGRRDTYDHAFILLAAAERWRCYRDREALLIADEVWRFLDQVASPHGGYQEGQPALLPRRQNPHMHLLEACLCWREAGDSDARLNEEIDALLTLHRSRFWDDDAGLLREFFDDDWQPHRDRGGVIEPGHMAEWVWLLREAGTPDMELIIASMQAARHVGLHPESGLLANTYNLPTGQRSEGCRLWPQTEYIRACVVLAELTREERWLDETATGLDILHRHYLSGVTPGCYHDEVDAAGRVLSDRSPASLIYHHVTLADALVKLKA